MDREVSDERKEEPFGPCMWLLYQEPKNMGKGARPETCLTKEPWRLQTTDHLMSAEVLPVWNRIWSPIGRDDPGFLVRIDYPRAVHSAARSVQQWTSIILPPIFTVPQKSDRLARWSLRGLWHCSCWNETPWARTESVNKGLTAASAWALNDPMRSSPRLSFAWSGR